MPDGLDNQDGENNENNNEQENSVAAEPPAISQSAPITQEKDVEAFTKLKDPSSYQMWKLEMDMLLTSRRLNKFASGLTTRTVFAENQKSPWDELDAETSLTITLTCAKPLRSYMLICPISHEKIENLKGIFERDGEHQKASTS